MESPTTQELIASMSHAQQALRFLMIVQQLGDPVGQGEAAEVSESLLIGEESLLGFEHLLRHPATLAFALIELYRHDNDNHEKRKALARRIRALLGDRDFSPSLFRRSRSRGLMGDGRPSLFMPVPVWRRTDEVLASLISRRLLEVEVFGTQPPRLAYRSTPRGTLFLEQQVYPTSPTARADLQACATLREFWPGMQRPETEGSMARPESWDNPNRSLGHSLEEVLARTGVWLDQLRQEEQIPLESDLLPVVFERTFRERL